MESHLQNPEFGNDPANFHPCICHPKAQNGMIEVVVQICIY